MAQEHTKAETKTERATYLRENIAAYGTQLGNSPEVPNEEEHDAEHQQKDIEE